MYKTNYHSHSTFCDGKSSLPLMCQSAFEHGFDYWGVSSHAPLNVGDTFALPNELVPLYIKEIECMQNKYAGKMHIFKGMELDYITDLSENIDIKAKQYGLDYFIGSVHQVKEHNNDNNTWFIDGHDISKYDKGLKELFDMDIKRSVRCFYEQEISMIENSKPDIIGHFDKIKMNNKGRYFSQKESWYKDLVMDLIDTIVKNDTIVEINTRGIYKLRTEDYYPSLEWIKILIQKKVPLTISTDCHNFTETDLLYNNVIDDLKALDCKEIYFFDKNWKVQYF